jgi:hypothetical protein
VTNPFQDALATSKPLGALRWNIVVIVVGALIAVVRLLAWFPAGSEEIVLLQSLVGLLIAAVGVAGATVFVAIERGQQSDEAAIQALGARVLARMQQDSTKSGS